MPTDSAEEILIFATAQLHERSVLPQTPDRLAATRELVDDIERHWLYSTSCIRRLLPRDDCRFLTTRKGRELTVNIPSAESPRRNTDVARQG